jgi:hypothetical protein
MKPQRERGLYVQKFRHDRGGRNLDEDNVVEADAVERVEQRKTTLDLVCFDHSLENVFDGDMLTLTCEVVGDSENGSEIVGRVTPFQWKSWLYPAKGTKGMQQRQTYILQRGSSR